MLCWNDILVIFLLLLVVQNKKKEKKARRYKPVCDHYKTDNNFPVLLCQSRVTHNILRRFVDTEDIPLIIILYWLSVYEQDA